MLFLLLLLGVAPLLGDRGLREPHRATALVSGLATATVVFMLVVNGLGRYIAIEQAAQWGVAVLAVLALLLLRAPRVAAQSWKLSRATQLYLGLGLAFVYAYSTLVQNISLDDDYWVHAPLMGLMKYETLPPVNPFFRDVQLNGHYGRDLLIASLSSLSGVNVLRTQLMLGTACAVLTFALLFSVILRSTRSQAAAVLATTLVTFGVDVGTRPGSIDTLQNNNPIVYVLLALFLLHYQRVGDKEGGGFTVVACGLTLGALAFTYETHFGLCVLAVLSTSAFRWWHERNDAWKRSALVLAIGALIALTQGGPFTQLARRAVSPPKVASATLAAEAGAEQMVALTFPKEHLFSLHLAEGDFRRISCGYQTFSFLMPYFPIAEGYPYAKIWSRDVLQIHWLATYLAAFSLYYACRQRLYAPVWLGFFAIFAFLTPAVVSFGHVFEFEYFRWHYAAGVGFAAALGAALGHLWDHARSRRSRAGWSVLMVVLTVLCVAPFFWRILPARLETARSLDPTWWLLAKPTGDWLRFHNGALGVLPNDTMMAAALRTMAKPGDTVLVNVPAYGQSAILMESTLSGLTSLPFTGHSLPTIQEAVETTPYRMSPPARAFWGSLDPLLLRQLGVKWLYLRPGPELRPNTLDRLSRDPLLRERARFQDSNGPYRLYQVLAPPLKSPTLASETYPVVVESLDYQDRSLEHSRYYEARITLRNEGKETVPSGALMAYQWTSRPGDRERVLFRLRGALAPGKAVRQTIPLVAPHAPGMHTLRVYLGPSPEPQSLYPLGPYPDTIEVY